MGSNALVGSNVVNELCELHCISLLLFSFSPKEILNFNLKQSVPRRHQSAEESLLLLDKPARLIIRLLFGFVSDSVFVKLNKNENKY